MRACVQRVTHAKVRVGDELVGAIDRGLLVLLGVATGDDKQDVDQLAEKLVHLRVFDDAQGKMNLSIRDIGGEMLIVSQFTLLGDCRRGRRPSFTEAASPDLAQRLYQDFCEAVRQFGVPVAEGRFRAMMQVELVNHGPVTLWLDTKL